MIEARSTDDRSTFATMIEDRNVRRAARTPGPIGIVGARSWPPTGTGTSTQAPLVTTLAARARGHCARCDLRDFLLSHLVKRVFDARRRGETGTVAELTDVAANPAPLRAVERRYGASGGSRCVTIRPDPDHHPRSPRWRHERPLPIALPARRERDHRCTRRATGRRPRARVASRGSALSRYAVGNVGTTRAGLLAPMPVAADLQAVLDAALTG
jgi:hypothetical protein